MFDLGGSRKIKEQVQEESISQGRKEWAERGRDHR